MRGIAFVCMLGAHLVWHLRQAWAPLTFKDESPSESDDPVVPAGRSSTAQKTAARPSRPLGPHCAASKAYSTTAPRSPATSVG